MNSFISNLVSLRWILARCCLALILVLQPGCTVMDPEYTALKARALTQCRGDEVVGVWISKITAVGFPQRRTLLLRPDGTGRLRVMTENVMIEEFEVSWRHSGGGVWDGTLSKGGHARYVIQMHTTGSQLLYRVNNIANVHAVFERADGL